MYGTTALAVAAKNGHRYNTACCLHAVIQSELRVHFYVCSFSFFADTQLHFVTCFRSIARLLILSSKKNLLLAKDVNGLTPVQHAIQGGTDRYRFSFVTLHSISSPPLSDSKSLHCRCHYGRDSSWTLVSRGPLAMILLLGFLSCSSLDHR